MTLLFGLAHLFISCQEEEERSNKSEHNHFFYSFISPFEIFQLLSSCYTIIIQISTSDRRVLNLTNSSLLKHDSRCIVPCVQAWICVTLFWREFHPAFLIKSVTAHDITGVIRNNKTRFLKEKKERDGERMFL